MIPSGPRFESAASQCHLCLFRMLSLSEWVSADCNGRIFLGGRCTSGDAEALWIVWM